MYVLVAGAAGMIGSHVADALISRGDRVLAIDDLSRGDPANLPDGCAFRHVDIRDRQAVLALAEGGNRFDAIVHQAAIINEGIDAEDTETDIAVNLVGTLNLLKLAKGLSVPRIVYASSVAVYGQPEELPATEDTTIPMPIASYGIGKLAAEHYVRYTAAESDMSFALLRYGNIYGPRQAELGEVGVIRHFVERLREAGAVTVHGDGTQVRDFLYIDDCVAATLAALDAEGNMTLNIASGQQTSVNEVVAALQEAMPGPFDVRRAPPRHGEIGRFWCSIDRARALLGWEPRVGLKEGVRRTLAWRGIA